MDSRRFDRKLAGVLMIAANVRTGPLSLLLGHLMAVITGVQAGSVSVASMIRTVRRKAASPSFTKGQGRMASHNSSWQRQKSVLAVSQRGIKKII